MKKVNVILGVEKSFNLDYNYNYEVLTELYHALDRVDNELCREIHDNKKITLFNFNLYFSEAKYDKKNINIKEGFINLTLSGKKEIVEKIIKGIMLDGFNLKGNSLKIKDLKVEKTDKIKRVCLYNVRTPIVTSKNSDFINIYDSEQFFANLGKNLLKKYKMVYGKKYEGELYFDIEDIFSIKKRLINNVKKGKLVGFSNFNIFIEADLDMQKVAYMCGLGERNSLGCGNLKFIKGFNE